MNFSFVPRSRLIKNYFFGRETVDSYTIAASPYFGNLGPLGSSIRYSSFGSDTKSNVDLDATSRLLSDHEIVNERNELDRISRTQSSWSDKAPFLKQLTGELPIGQGCSFTQTVFNGK